MVPGPVPLDLQSASRPRIAVACDSPHWAFANIAYQLRRTLRARYDVEVIPEESLGDDPFRILLALTDFSLVHCLWRLTPAVMRSAASVRRGRALGIDAHALYQEKFRQTAITFGVYDHMYLEPDWIRRNRRLFAMVDGYSVSSAKLDTIYRGIPDYPAPSAILMDGVDLDLFRPERLQRLQEDRPLVLGWAGNSRWGDAAEDVKGVATIIRPALQILAARGIAVVEHFADGSISRRPQHEMPAYYGEIDVCLCASLHEGTPNPLLEAMASGVPVISTDVGIAGEVFGPLQRQFLTPRTPAAFADAIERLHRNPALRAALSAENLVSIEAHGWPRRAVDFARFFDAALQRKAAAARVRGLP